MPKLISLCALFAVLWGCDATSTAKPDASPTQDSAPKDKSSATDTAAGDSSANDSAALPDGSTVDSKRLADALIDAAPSPDVAVDATSGPDASADLSAPPDTTVDSAPPTPVTLESATLGPTGQVTGAGTVISSVFFSGWRFETKAALTVSAVGGHLMNTSGDRKLAVAIVKLTDGTDKPDSNDLSSADVIKLVHFSLPAGASSDVKIPYSTTLAPGWYAVIFAAGLGGDPSGNSAMIVQNNTWVSGAQPVFALRTTDGAMILQGNKGRVFVEGTTP